MVVAINTKFNFGDEVYLVMPGHDYYVEKTPYKVVSFDVDVSPDYTKVRYLIEQHGKEVNITPVPGGVGPMTVAELMKNVVQAWRKKYE